MPRRYVTTQRWVDCPTLGPGQPVRTEQVSRGMLGLMGFSPETLERAFQWRDFSYRPYVMQCGGCGAPAAIEVSTKLVKPRGSSHTIRSIEVPQRAETATGKCNGVCLNGKRSCDCQCRGRCHGAGRCTCALAPR